MIVVMLLLPIGITMTFMLFTENDAQIQQRGRVHKPMTLINLFALFWLSKLIKFPICY